MPDEALVPSVAPVPNGEVERVRRWGLVIVAVLFAACGGSGKVTVHGTVTATKPSVPKSCAVLASLTRDVYDLTFKDASGKAVGLMSATSSATFTPGCGARSMHFCSKGSEGILCSGFCSLSPSVIVTESPVSIYGNGVSIPGQQFLIRAKAASFAAFYFPSQPNRR